MMREFKFEDEMSTTLACVPMAVRRKLDRVGVKVGLEQWKALGRGERLAICHLPVERHDEREAFRLFINEAVRRAFGAEPRTLAEAQRAIADPPSRLPAPLAERARAAGVPLDQAAWERLDGDERYALIKLGGGPEVSHNLAAALAEFVQR
ncbi:MAG TPA: nitrate reductase associated protein [Candidatus Binataceae bacterium]|nr:nitrate reductase associated protein [Candidatus Binataceae bacterium]